MGDRSPNDYIDILYPGYIPGKIRPCAAHYRYSERWSVPDEGFHHLLDCGHIVVVDATVRRCAKNCLHITKKMALPKDAILNIIVYQIQLDLPRQFLIPISGMQDQDVFYCEACNGVPIDRYRSITPLGTLEDAGISRRCLGLTSNLDHVQTEEPNLAHAHTEESLCPSLVESDDDGPFYRDTHFLVEPLPEDDGPRYRDTHFLQCGHYVWCAPRRPCASNCSSTKQCNERLHPMWQFVGKQSDAILCQECFIKVESVYGLDNGEEKKRDKDSSSSNTTDAKSSAGHWNWGIESRWTPGIED